MKLRAPFVQRDERSCSRCRTWGPEPASGFAGVLPVNLVDQAAAQRLAMCNDIGEASYEATLITVALLESIRKLACGPSILEVVEQRCGLQFPPEMTGVHCTLSAHDTGFAEGPCIYTHGGQESGGERARGLLPPALLQLNKLTLQKEPAGPCVRGELIESEEG